MVPDIGDITAVLEGTPHTLLPATTAGHTTLQPKDTSITPYTKVTPLPKLNTSLTGATPWTGASLTPATPTTQHKDLSQSNAQNSTPNKPNCPQTVTIQDSHSESSSDFDSDSDPLNY